MNCKQFNSISLEEVLASLGHLPTKQTEKEVWYLSPFGAESQTSFKVDRSRNLWYLFSEGIGGTTTDFIQKYLCISVKEALEWATEKNFSSFQSQRNDIKFLPNYHIDRVIGIAHPNLIRYLDQCGLTEKVYPFIKELWFTIENKQLYAIGFKNNSDGRELRNAFYKGALHKKDITLLPFSQEIESINDNRIIERNNQKIAVFEGFIDALTFIEMQKSFQGDIMVLNSTTMVKKALMVLEKYTEINLFLDNDKAEKKCTWKILKDFPHAKNFSYIYAGSKDLNQHFMEVRKKQWSIAQKGSPTPTSQHAAAQKQDNGTKENNRITKGLRRRM